MRILLLLSVFCATSHSALQLSLRVSTSPEMTNAFQTAQIVSTKLIQAKHRTRLCSIFAERIKAAEPRVKCIRAHVHRRSTHEWVTAVEVQSHGKHKRIFYSKTAQDALDNILNMTSDIHQLVENAKASSLINA